MILSLEAILLSMLILNSSNRQVARDSAKIHENADISIEVRADVKNLHDDIEEILGLLDIEVEDNKYTVEQNGAAEPAVTLSISNPNTITLDTSQVTTHVDITQLSTNDDIA